MKNIIKSSFKTEVLPIIFILITIICSFYFYANFPEQVPTHRPSETSRRLEGLLA